MVGLLHKRPTGKSQHLPIDQADGSMHVDSAGLQERRSPPVELERLVREEASGTGRVCQLRRLQGGHPFKVVVVPCLWLGCMKADAQMAENRSATQNLLDVIKLCSQVTCCRQSAALTKQEPAFLYCVMMAPCPSVVARSQALSPCSEIYHSRASSKSLTSRTRHPEKDESRERYGDTEQPHNIGCRREHRLVVVGKTTIHVLIVL
jgi:hypothetical protein